jgi:hypothetical protein
MVGVRPTGINLGSKAAKELEFDLETAWKKLSARRALCEKAYIALVRADADGSPSSALAFAEWQTANAELAAARDQYECLDKALRAAAGKTPAKSG